MTDYRVNLDVFAGPMDLLLYLVRKEEVDIYDISITKVTDQYIRYIEILKNLDINLASDFLVMAATLMHIKSAMLLPKSNLDDIENEDDGDPRKQLIRQLLEYKKFKDAANLLDASALQQQQRYNRPNTLIEKMRPQSEPEVDLEQVSVWNLLEAFDAIMAATGSYQDISQIEDETPTDLYQIEILHRLQSDGSMRFERIFENKPNRLVLVGNFLALLELIRNGLIWAEQDQTTNHIFLKSLTDEPAEQAVQKAMIKWSDDPEPQNTGNSADSNLKSENKSKVQSPPIPIATLEAKSQQKIESPQ